ncbi:Hypothetical_protein [Hexamita inflata]|uniref:Hypothetical_protein n=1 Tax=Hexamita inflata TaxID=28002 RepID=A0AA86R9F8_9EUKA|nr:Hypothetical protein HINF_LOCUS56407 [Hexamita inflata]
MCPPHSRYRRPGKFTTLVSRSTIELLGTWQYLRSPIQIQRLQRKVILLSLRWNVSSQKINSQMQPFVAENQCVSQLFQLLNARTILLTPQFGQCLKQRIWLRFLANQYYIQSSKSIQPGSQNYPQQIHFARPASSTWQNKITNSAGDKEYLNLSSLPF